MKTKLKLIAALSVASMGLSISSANADVIGQSVLEINNLIFKNNATGNRLSIADFNFIQITDNTTLLSSLNGTVSGDSISSHNPLDAGLTMDLGMTCVGDCGTQAENDFTQHLPPATSSYARADSYLTGSPIILNPFLPPPVGGSAKTVGDSRLIGEGEGNTSSDLGLSTQFAFNLASNMVVDISFDATAFMLLHLGATQVVDSSTYTAMNWSVTVDKAGGGFGSRVFSWSPNGEAGGITGGTETLDPFSLNTNGSLQSPFNATSTYDHTGTFAARTNTLTAGTAYILTISHGVDTAIKAVPEPATLALLGLGLLGMGASLSRKRRAAV